MPNVYISKSKYVWGLQCPKLLWHAHNAKDLIPEPDAAQQAIFDQRHEVGALASRPPLRPTAATAGWTCWSRSAGTNGTSSRSNRPRASRRSISTTSRFSQLGSYSIKAVLPALTGRGYGHLAIQEGGTASLEFLRVTFGDATEDERQRVRRQLEEYCGLDTEGMIWIVGRLQRLAA